MLFTIVIIKFSIYHSIYFHKNALCVQVRCKAAEHVHIKLTASSFGLVGSGIFVCHHHYI